MCMSSLQGGPAIARSACQVVSSMDYERTSRDFTVTASEPARRDVDVRCVLLISTVGRGGFPMTSESCAVQSLRHGLDSGVARVLWQGRPPLRSNVAAAACSAASC